MDECMDGWIIGWVETEAGLKDFYVYSKHACYSIVTC